MSMGIKASEATVGMTDELMKAIEAAHARIEEVNIASTGISRTALIATFTPTMFAELDGTDEAALVADQNGLDYDDCIDEMYADAA